MGKYCKWYWNRKKDGKKEDLRNKIEDNEKWVRKENGKVDWRRNMDKWRYDKWIWIMEILEK